MIEAIYERFNLSKVVSFFLARLALLQLGKTRQGKM